MTEAKKIVIIVGEYEFEAYQNDDDEILLTHRQIGEVVGKTKATAQRFLKQREEDLPLPVKATIPERRGKIPLTPWASALAYWQYQAENGNSLAQGLITAIAQKNEVIGSYSVNELPIKKELEVESSPETNTTLENSNLSVIAEGIEVAARWMIESGIDAKAISAWKLSQLGQQVPELAGIVASAQELIATHSTTPSGMITSQLAKKLSTTLERKITPAKTNQALHDLELQDWAKPGVNRERKLTERGKKYGVALLTTSSEGWQGAQLRWFDSVIPLLVDYFQELEVNDSRFKS